jgi:protein-S-isoprenylcysteine O-methyltransferase Ste14
MAATIARAFFLAVFASWVGGELWIQRTHRLPEDAADRDRGSMALLVASVWVAVVLGIAVAALVPSAAIGTGSSTAFLLGTALMVAGMALRWYAITTLGSAFTVTVGASPAQPIVEQGPYRWVRHPSYGGSLITILGVLVCCGNFLSLALVTLPIAGHAYRIRVEERAMVDVLGDTYRDYMRRTKRLVPLVL